MSVTALETVANLTVSRMAWAPGQARTLDCNHDIPWDSAEALDVGAAVTYTDADLDAGHPCFVGKIVAREKRANDAQGWVYHCADAYRVLAKNGCTVEAPNNHGATCLVSVPAGTRLDAAFTKVTGCVAAELPGGVAVDATIAATLTKSGLDRGGAFVSDWLDDLLKQTDNGSAYILPNAGSPKLAIVPYYGQPDVALELGTFGVLNLDTAKLTMIEAEGGESLNGRYQKVRCEGAGSFLRRRGVAIVGQAGNAINGGLREWLFPVPNHEKPLRRMIEGGACKDATSVTLTRGGMSMTIANPPVGKYPGTNGGWYFLLHLGDAGGAPTGVFDYTVYNGPLSAVATAADARLEGELAEVHDEFFKYTDPGDSGNNVDQSALLQELAALRLVQVGSVEWTGNVALFIKGLNSAIKPGVRITNLGGAIMPRIGAITYDLASRTMTCDLARTRDEADAAKAQKRWKLGLNSGNWTQNALAQNPEAGESNCFSGWKETDGDPESTDTLKGPTGGIGGDTGWGDWNAQKGRFSCVAGQCVPDEHGFYGGIDSCQRDCGGGGGWYCMDKVNSVCAASGGGGGSWSAEECGLTCIPSDATLVQRWVSFPDGCKQVWALPTEGFATQVECVGKVATQYGCPGGALGSVSVNDRGAVVKSQCVTPKTLTVVTSATCANGNINVSTASIKVFP